MSDLPEPVSNDVPPGRRRQLTFVTIGWLFGAVWFAVTSGAPLTVFARNLGASEFQIGLLAAMPFLAAFLSLPASLIPETTGHRKRTFMIALYSQRLLWIPIAIVPTWLAYRAGGPTQLAVAVFLILYFIMQAGQAVGGPAWVSWMADVVPNRIRSRFFARRRQWGILTAVPATLLAGYIIDRQADAGWLALIVTCAVIFLCVTPFGLLDIAVFQFVPHELKKTPVTSRRTMMLRPLRDKPFLWFSGFVGTMIFALSFMGQFLTLYLLERLKVTNTGVQLMLLAVPMAATLLFLPVWGRVVDRMGKKPAVVIGALGLVPVGLGWCFMNEGLIWLGYFLSAAGAVLWAGTEIANLNLVLQFGASSQKTDSGGAAYVAVNSVIINIAGCLGGLLAGGLAYTLRDWTYELGLPGLRTVTYFEVLFAISAALRLLAVVIFLPRVHEPTAKPTLVALRYMTGNIYNNAWNFLSTPLRLFKAKDEAA